MLIRDYMYNLKLIKICFYLKKEHSNVLTYRAFCKRNVIQKWTFLTLDITVSKSKCFMTDGPTRRSTRKRSSTKAESQREKRNVSFSIVIFFEDFELKNLLVIISAVSRDDTYWQNVFFMVTNLLSCKISVFCFCFLFLYECFK